MPRWTEEEVKKLHELVSSEKPRSRGDWERIASEFERHNGADAVKMKAKRLGLNVVVDWKRGATTTDELDIPDGLLTVEEALKMLAAALNMLGKTGLNKVEIRRLQVIVTAVKAYQNLFADYVHYRQIEERLVELEAKYAHLAKEEA